MSILDESGPADAVDYLTQWEYGDETTMASLTYGYVYDEFGEGTNDQAITSGDDALVVNTGIGYVSLLRRYSEPGAETQDADVPGAKRDGSWFEPARIAAVKQARGLGL